MATNVRPLTQDERAHVAGVLRELRDHFSVWPTEPGKEWFLVGFAYYEGCGERDQWCVDNFRESSPLALGSTLVHDYGFEWCAFQAADSARFAVRHSKLTKPIDLYELEASPLLDPDYHDEDTEPFEPGKGAHQSMYAILRTIGETDPYEC